MAKSDGGLELMLGEDNTGGSAETNAQNDIAPF